jgi:phosphatidylglycerophosphate synthase
MIGGPGSARQNEIGTASLAPAPVVRVALRALYRLATVFVRLGITANAVTLSSLVLATIGGVLLCLGLLGLACPVMAIASLGDAVDGLIARRTRSASVGGALLDASVDRYEEFLFLGGLAVYLRASAPALLLVLFALAGSFMVSYGSAKAEALGVPVPSGAMRRAERAICLCLGVGATPVFGWLAAAGAVPGWAARAPLFAALGIIAIVANISAVRRLRALAHASLRGAPPEIHCDAAAASDARESLYGAPTITARS